jgi:hypothetical protein
MRVEGRIRSRVITRGLPAALVVGLAVLVVEVAGPLRGPSASSTIVAGASPTIAASPSRSTSGPMALVPSQDVTNPDAPSYPKSMALSSVSAASQAASFNLIVPETTQTSSSQLIGVYLLPGRSVALDYAPAKQPSSFVRQDYIEVYESSWETTDGAPAKAYDAMVVGDNNPAESVTTVAGLPALIVKPHSPADVQQANPAFLRMVIGGVEIQVSGGDDLNLITDIAQSMASQK